MSTDASAGELVGKMRLADLISARFLGDYKRTIDALIAGRDISETEIELIRKDGSTFDAFLRIAAVRNHQRINCGRGRALASARNWTIPSR